MNVYVIGCNPSLKPKDILRLVKQHEANPIPIVVDIRATRGARINKAFDLRKVPALGVGNGRYIGEVIPGCRYVWTPELGNASRKLPWRPADVKKARKVIEVAATYFDPQADAQMRGPLVLLCGCREARKCHRSQVADALADEVERLTGERPEVLHLE